MTVAFTGSSSACPKTLLDLEVDGRGTRSSG